MTLCTAADDNGNGFASFSNAWRQCLEIENIVVPVAYRCICNKCGVFDIIERERPIETVLSPCIPE